MISAKEALLAFEKKHKDLTVTDMIDYDSKFFVITAVKDLSTIDFNDPYYAIRKSDGVECSFSPMDNLDTFLEASVERNIDISEF